MEKKYKFKCRIYDLSLKRPKFYTPTKDGDCVAISLDGTITAGYIDGDMMTFEDQDELVVQLFTGFKDKNGKEIYDGDILQLNIPEYHFNDQVILHNGWFTLSNSKDEYPLSFFNSTSTVIGNIFDNPDLLTKNK